MPFCLGQNTALLSPRINGRFLHFVLQSADARRQIEHAAVGSTQKTISLKSISALRVPLPPPEELEAIAHILGTLDDKIELSRRMNETLEAMARALFKSWFVDFDPVRAKAEGRDPGLPKPLADLFPARLVDSELGEIPEGWEVGRLGDVLCQRVERCVASAETAARPYVPIDCISPKSLFLAESKSGAEAQSSLTKFYKDDLLFGAMRPYFHKVCIAPFDGTTRTTAFVLYPKHKDDFAFATLLLHDPETIDFATRHSTGSTIPYAVWVDSMDTMPTILPPSDVRAAFNDTVRPVLARIPQPYFESRTLAALRGTLLPKLISGELRIRDAEEFLERTPC
jgi:type I restriction enzyme S subunit